MTKRLPIGVLLCISVASGTNLAFAQSSTAERRPTIVSPRPDRPVSAQEPAIDPEAIAALRRMGAFLRKQESFAVKGETLTDQVLNNGQNVQLAGKVDLLVKRPDGLRAEITTDRKRRTLIYDGKTFTAYGKGTGYYASFAAPPTLREVVQVAKERYDVDVPLADLFYWGSDQDAAASVESAMDVGPATIDGRRCDHYAFRQGDVDWQIWIQQGAEPLPCKFVITNTSLPSQPQHVVTMTWDLDPQLPASFKFHPPKGSHRIVFEGQRIKEKAGS
jgi:hypothetical protein